MTIAAGRHSRFLQLAAREAENSEQETKHGSLLVRGGKVLGSGHNSSRSRLQAMPGSSNVTSLHSEVCTPVPRLPHCCRSMHRSVAAASLLRSPPTRPRSWAQRPSLRVSPGCGCLSCSVGFTRLKVMMTVPKAGSRFGGVTCTLCVCYRKGARREVTAAAVALVRATRCASASRSPVCAASARSTRSACTASFSAQARSRAEARWAARCAR